MSSSTKNEKPEKKDLIKKNPLLPISEDIKPQYDIEDKLDEVMDENLITLKKVHSILLNCINLTKKQKLEFAESERFFMKLHLKKLLDRLKDSQI